jgi:2,4-dienoyl-CoA reductase (NADPH2)
VRDARNPIVTCIGEPTSGRETEDPDWYEAASVPRAVAIIGAGPAGLEAARVARLRGHDVTLIERADHIGGMAAIAGPHTALIDWYGRELERLGTTIDFGDEAVDAQAAAMSDADVVVIQCTGSQPGVREYEVADDAVPLHDVADVRRETVTLPASGRIALFDPIGGPIAVELAEQLGDRAMLITQDNIAGNELSRTGDLAPANTRLARAAVDVQRRSILRAVTSTGVDLEDRFSGERRTLACAAVVDCGFRLPDDPLESADHRAGDAVAPRTVLEAVLEGRRVASRI